MKGWPRNVLAEVWDSELFPCDSLKSRVLRTGSVDGKSRFVASLDRKRLGQTLGVEGISIGGVFDKETRRKPLAFAADAVRYGISTIVWAARTL